MKLETFITRIPKDRNTDIALQHSLRTHLIHKPKAERDTHRKRQKKKNLIIIMG